MTQSTRRPSGCDVCGAATSVTEWRGFALLCPLHTKVIAGILPSPQSVKEIRALFPARVVAAARRGDAA